MGCTCKKTPCECGFWPAVDEGRKAEHPMSETNTKQWPEKRWAVSADDLTTYHYEKLPPRDSREAVIEQVIGLLESVRSHGTAKRCGVCEGQLFHALTLLKEKGA